MSKAPGKGRWRLETVRIRHFRGVEGEREVRFDGMPGILHGANGVGKSTVAQCLQWTLYGELPKPVLQKKSHARFLAPVQGKQRAYFGQVTFRRGKERIVVCRDESADSFTLSTGSSTYQDEDAETKLDELLGLDMDTFCRAVLLQQSRIRGILLDEPKDRNKALDRLLGLDAVDEIVPLLKPDSFSDAAAEWREKIEKDQQHYEDVAEVLADQLKEAQQEAHELGFFNKHFSPVGLEKAFAALSEMLGKIGAKYGVELDEMAPCGSPAKADAAVKKVEQSIRKIRRDSPLQARRAENEATLAALRSIKSSFHEALTTRDEAQKALAEWEEEHGSSEAVQKERAQVEEELKEHRERLTAASALRELLKQARTYMEKERPSKCPVCEQTIPRAPELGPKLQKRARALTSELIDNEEAAIKRGEARLDELKSATEVLKTLNDDLSRAQRALNERRRAAAKALGEQAIPEPKTAARIDAAIAKHNRERDTLSEKIESMEGELAKVSEGGMQILQGLVPVLKKRRELTEHEKKQDVLAKVHAGDLARAEQMERLATQLECIRKALFSAKMDLSARSLETAGPRALTLYRKLVRHPVFTTLSISTATRYGKVDYDFTVSVEGAKSTAREARLVLSDGQLTAASLGLFFALAESTEHELDLLYVDDPTQNLDHSCKEAMARVITDLAQRKQVIVSTHDEDFVHLLEEYGFGKQAVSYHIAKWDGNPKYEVTTPSAADA